jgi:hypothetical protein
MKTNLYLNLSDIFIVPYYLAIKQNQAQLFNNKTLLRPKERPGTNPSIHPSVRDGGRSRFIYHIHITGETTINKPSDATGASYPI